MQVVKNSFWIKNPQILALLNLQGKNEIKAHHPKTVIVKSKKKSYEKKRWILYVVQPDLASICSCPIAISLWHLHTLFPLYKKITHKLEKNTDILWHCSSVFDKNSFCE